ncbi:MAG: hypothetical protein FK730_05415 [Asgard group archaeon]|nr:hypothetical protein [Asgard group archaeon]
MEKQYCVYCGFAVSVGDSFCHKCGSKIQPTKTIQELHNESLGEKEVVEAPIVKTNLIKRHGKKLIIIPFILAIILIPTIAIGTIVSVQKPLGVLYYDIPDTGIASIDLSITNDIGSVTVLYDDSISSLFEAVITVRGGLRASIDDAVNFNHEVVGDSLNVNFYYSNFFESLFNMKKISHEIVVFLNPTAKVDYNIDVATGSISVFAENEDNIAIEDLYLSSATGSVKFHGIDLNNLTLNDVSLSSSTGRIVFDLEGSTNTYLTGLSLDTSTGSIFANLGQYTTLDCSSVILDTSTGSVTLQYDNIIYNDDIQWSLSTSTGSINLAIEQTLLSPTNASMSYILDTSTGSITTVCELNSEIGIEMEADTSTGRIELPNGKNYYISTDYALKSIQYSFIMSTSTGSITASVF